MTIRGAPFSACAKSIESLEAVAVVRTTAAFSRAAGTAIDALRITALSSPPLADENIAGTEILSEAARFDVPARANVGMRNPRPGK